MIEIDVLLEGFLNFKQNYSFLAPYRTINGRIVRDGSKNHKKSTESIQNKFCFDPFLGNFIFLAKKGLLR